MRLFWKGRELKPALLCDTMIDTDWVNRDSVSVKNDTESVHMKI